MDDSVSSGLVETEATIAPSPTMAIAMAMCPACRMTAVDFIHFGDCFRCAYCGFVVCCCRRVKNTCSINNACALVALHEEEEEENLREWVDGDDPIMHQHIELK